MSKVDDTQRLRDMLTYARKALAAVKGKGRVDLESDDVLAAALERFVEVIGEAASRVTEGTRDSLPDLPWRQVIGMRNRLIHGYTSVDKDVLWNVVQADLPPFVEKLVCALGDS